MARAAHRPPAPAAPASEEEIRIGISSCLLGEPVRYDGGHKRDPFLAEVAARWVRWVPVCPEAEAGLGIPREPMQLVAGETPDAPRLLVIRSGIDHSVHLRRWGRRRLRDLAAERLDGFVLKRNSPSCGQERVPIHAERGRARARRQGTGLFAAELLVRLPLLPVEEEGRLADPIRRAHFFTRVFAHQRLARAFRPRWTREQVARFLAGEEFLLRAHEPGAIRALAALLAAAAVLPRAELARRLQERFMAALRRPAPPRRHGRALRRVLRLLRSRLAAGEHEALGRAIEDHEQGRVPRLVPLDLLRHAAERAGAAALAAQSYLAPVAAERALAYPD